MAFDHSLLLLSFSIFFQLPTTHSVKAGNGGFSVEIIHHDSPISPLYNPSHTFSDRVTKALQRSNARANFFYSIINPSSTSNKIIQSNVVNVIGEYLMTYSIGTPAVKVIAVADTGSGLIWTQCKPCVECFEQQDPLYDPRKSSTYRNLSCKSKQCSQDLQGSCGSRGVCKYSYAYGDSTFSNGTLATETLTFDSTSGSNIKLHKTVIGCGHANQKVFDKPIDGIVGLTGDSTSLISQLGPLIDGKFSYCLLPWTDTTSTSLLNFGHNAIVSGPGVLSTPLFSKSPFYILNLEYITVGGQKVQVTASNRSGNILIDSGTTFNYLDDSTYNNVLSKVKGMVKSPRVKDPNQQFDLCFKNSSLTKVPDLMFGFTNAELVLPPTNLFVRVTDTVICLAMSSGSPPIFGNFAQQNLKVEYDLEEMTVSFLSTDCTKH